MNPKVFLAALAVATGAMATAPAVADPVDPMFSWADAQFSSVNGQRSVTFVGAMGNGTIDVTIESFNPRYTGSNPDSTYHNQMSWDGTDGIGIDGKNSGRKDYWYADDDENDEIDGKYELLRFTFSDPVTITRLHVSDLFADEVRDNDCYGNCWGGYNGTIQYDEWGYFRINSDEKAQIYDEDTIMFWANEEDGEGTGQIRTADSYWLNQQSGLPNYSYCNPSTDYCGSDDANAQQYSMFEDDGSNGEWIIVLPEATQVTTIDFWALGEWCPKDLDFALLGVDVPVPTSNGGGGGSVPEPAPFGLLLAGLLGVGAARWQRSRKA